MAAKSFREAIRDKRIMDGEKPGAVAAALGVSRPALYSWERGDSTPTEDKWAAIAAWLGLADWRELESMIEADRASGRVAQ